jgi:LuxR family transcriptional regulator, quorum-sensing system regulator BjaR1
MQERRAKILAAIDAIEQAPDTVAVLDGFSTFVRSYGFTRYFIGQLVNPLSLPSDRIMHVTDWPSELMQRRMARLAILHDPVMRCATRSRRPFSWSSARAHASRMGLKNFDEARDFALNDGMMFPMHGLDSTPGGVSLGTEHLDIGPREIAEVEIVSQHCYYKLEQLMGGDPYQVRAELSPRETEVITIAAVGKSNWEIGKILDIGEETVKATLARACRKLNASNRAHAVATAIAQGLIMA